MKRLFYNVFQVNNYVTKKVLTACSEHAIIQTVKGKTTFEHWKERRTHRGREEPQEKQFFPNHCNTKRPQSQEHNHKKERKKRK
jgi:hypothetical protein